MTILFVTLGLFTLYYALLCFYGWRERSRAAALRPSGV